MNAYRWSVRLKLGLIVFAVVLAVGSLWYTQRLVDRLQEREHTVIQLWADVQEEVVQAQRTPGNPHREEFRRLESYLETLEQSIGLGVLSSAEVAAFQEAVEWAQTMPATPELDFMFYEILRPNSFGIPAIITDSTRQQPLFWRNVGVADTSLSALSPSDSAQAMSELRSALADMKATFEPIPVRIQMSGDSGADDVSQAGGDLTQYVFYDESALIRELRIYPWIQFLFVGLFVFVGYVGFSYVRRSEQSSLWMGMAREAAHQLGTPLSSLLGWIEMLRASDADPEQREQALNEIENDVERLQRVANRFSDIGSQPKLERCNLVPIVEQTADYLRRRIPQRGQEVTLTVDLPERLGATANEELFAWVLENLLKNALDAIDDGGTITVTGGTSEDAVYIEVTDTGSGIERGQRKNVFRPGYSTKKRGWGLGLSLARRIVESYHGGSIDLVSTAVGEGATFRVEVPV